MKGNLFVVSGPSGVGKGTICEKVRDNDGNIFISISVTTREVRDNDIPGVTYNFISDEEFDRMIENNEFYEWAKVHSGRYGTPRKIVEEKRAQGIDVILEIDVQGGMIIKEQSPEAVMVFVVPPSMEILEQRLRDRHTETEEEIRERLKNAVKEIEYEDRYEHIIVNDNLDEAVRELHDLILNERNS